jgi:hypothetical protein
VCTPSGHRRWNASQEQRVDALRAPPIVILNSGQIISSQLNSSVSGSAHLCLSSAGNAGVTILLVAIAMVLSLRASGEIPARYGTGGKKHYGKADASKGTLERELEPGQMVQLGSGRSVRFVDKFAGRNRINVGVNARRYEFEEITAV